jgi:hypothetical protein
LEALSFLCRARLGFVNEGVDMLKDEYNRLIKLFHEGTEGRAVNLNEVFTHSLEFFQHLKVQIEEGGPEEKKEAMAMMAEMYNQMMLETKKITERSGLSEEQLLAYAENPANFTSEQWQQIQESKSKISEAGQDLTKVLKDLNKGVPFPGTPSKEEKKGAGGKKSKKSQWMRS